MSPQHVALFAEYNRWMNERLYEAAAGLTEAELTADRGAFFGSILGTLNHIAVADTVWMQRFAAHPPGFASLVEMADLHSPRSLREPMAPDFAGLRAYRARLDALVLRWAEELSPDHLAGPFSFARMSGERMTLRLGDVLLHFFNHQTHHRGQVSTLLSQLGIDIGVTDLLVKLPAVDA